MLSRNVAAAAIARRKRPEQPADPRGAKLVDCEIRSEAAISPAGVLRCAQYDGTKTMEDELGLPAGAFTRIDNGADESFYEEPRLVYHIDDHAVAVLTGFYRTVLPAGGVVLDLMSSWVSHLPPEQQFTEVIGHGMNAQELAANPRLSRWFVQNLNCDPALPLPDCGVDAATICVSVQYLQQPVAVLREVARVLRPGGVVVISFSNRCFWTKAVAIWRATGDEAHAALVERYLRLAGFDGTETHRLAEWIEDEQDPLIAVVGRSPATH
jgi:methyltransferase family protein